ncbi:MAG: NADAR family protein [Vicinamibacterales bacterium]
MRIFVKRAEMAVVLTPDEWAGAASTCGAWDGHVFRATRVGGALVLGHLGLHDDVLAVPINVSSRHPDAGVRLLSNFAATPFDLHGKPYASVEGFWQSLRAPSPGDRARIALLSGPAAKHAGAAYPAPSHVRLVDREVAWGSPEHWDLMREACRAKFSQVEAASAALLATAPRPLQHRTRVDSRSIPGRVMASIWMGLRTELSLTGRAR